MTETEIDNKIAEITLDTLNLYLLEEDMEILEVKNLVFKIAKKIALWAYDEGRKSK